MTDMLWTTTEAAGIAGCAPRMADYYVRTGHIVIKRPGQGSGSRAGWDRGDVRVLWVATQLAEAGYGLAVRAFLTHGDNETTIRHRTANVAARQVGHSTLIIDLTHSPA